MMLMNGLSVGVIGAATWKAGMARNCGVSWHLTACSNRLQSLSRAELTRNREGFAVPGRTSPKGLAKAGSRAAKLLLGAHSLADCCGSLSKAFSLRAQTYQLNFFLPLYLRGARRMEPATPPGLDQISFLRFSISVHDGTC